MKKFLVLYHSSASAKDMMGKATPEQLKGGMEDWVRWAKENEDAIVELGMPIGDGKIIKSDDAIVQTKNMVSGYSILQENSMDSVVKILKNHPHFKTPGDSFIEVFELLSMPEA